ncbi:MAG: Rieske (2Fe-2S) protein [Phycisphaerae bacterium]|nr:Rieske (2Fe-2S) protein [Phycisphaerae bacterium]
MAWVTLCESDELVEGEGKYVEIDGFHLAVFLDGDEPAVIDDRCPHAGGSLSGGVVMNRCAICPWHGWAFALRDGTLQGAPQISVTRYPTRFYQSSGKRFVQADLPMP